MTDFNRILREGKIVDNKRVKSLNMKEVLKTIAQDSDSFKCAVGYFYLEGLVEIINSLKSLKEIKILMGYETTRPTKKELIRAFKEQFNRLEVNEQTKPAIALFYQLVREYETLKIRVYFGGTEEHERLHSKAYLFLRDFETKNLLERYKAGIVGSSNLTPSGLVGNTELNVILTEPRDLEDVEIWFENLWKKGTDDFEKLKVADALREAIEESKFKDEIKDVFLYIEPKEFFKLLIKYLKADYLFEEYKKSGLFSFQYIDFIRLLNNFNGKGYRGAFLTSSVGLGKSYVAAQIAKYFLKNGQKVLIIAPAGLVKSEDQWPRYLKEFRIFEKVKLVSMGLLQKKPDVFKHGTYSKNYDLIIVDEAHNYRNEDAYRTRNLKKIIDENGESKVLFLTATPVNTSLDDLLNLVKLFYRKGSNPFFDKSIRELSDIINIFKDKEWEELSKKEKLELSRKQEDIEKELFVKSTRGTIKTSPEFLEELKTFSGVDLTKIPDPDTKEVKYQLDENYIEVVNGIVDFIDNLSAAHLRILDPEKGVRLRGFFKWILYKRFESDISSYYLTLLRLFKKNTLIKKCIDKKDASYLEDEDDEDDINIAFGINFKENLSEVIAKIKEGQGAENLAVLDDLKKDTSLINQEIGKLAPYVSVDENKKILFKKDNKIRELYEGLRDTEKKILVFSEYKDTINAIKLYLKDRIESDTIRFVDSDTKNKNAIVERFNNPEDNLRILVTTDTLSEGFNISGADVVVNFDIPYNPVRIIQRIGRATRLDKPKKIKVLNFRPDDSIDVELNLVDTMELRIKDIIRFVGVEYRIWFEKEEELLKTRRKRDIRLYREVLDSIRTDLREGNFENLEIELKYTKPVLMLLQRAIREYGLKIKDIKDTPEPSGKYYTLLTGRKNLSAFYDGLKSYNEDILIDASLEPATQKVNFLSEFNEQLTAFEKERWDKVKQEKILEYYTDNLDRSINSILDKIESKQMGQTFKDIPELVKTLENVKERCGSTTEKTIRKIKSGIMRTDLSNSKIKEWVGSLKESFRKIELQQKLVKKQQALFAIGFLEE